MTQELNPLALEALKNNQRQLDADGCEVGVSRQALHELIAAYEALSALPSDGSVKDWTRRIARAWASIDGWTDEFDRESQPNVKYDAPEYTGHYEGYMSEAAELIHRAGLLPILAALRSASPESQWRPITEAPHAIKLLIGWREPTGEWNCVVGQASWGHRDETTGISNRSWHGRATHWMPLPAAPSKGERP